MFSKIWQFSQVEGFRALRSGKWPPMYLSRRWVTILLAYCDPAGMDWSVSGRRLMIFLSEMKKCVSKLKIFCSKNEEYAPAALDPVLLSVRQKPIEEFLSVQPASNVEKTRSVFNLREFNRQSTLALRWQALEQLNSSNLRKRGPQIKIPEIEYYQKVSDLTTGSCETAK